MKKSLKINLKKPKSNRALQNVPANNKWKLHCSSWPFRRRSTFPRTRFSFVELLASSIYKSRLWTSATQFTKHHCRAQNHHSKILCRAQSHHWTHNWKAQSDYWRNGGTSTSKNRNRAKNQLANRTTDSLIPTRRRQNCLKRKKSSCVNLLRTKTKNCNNWWRCGLQSKRHWAQGQ